MYLNGEMVGDHDCGYTSFAIRIDNTTAVKYGAGAANENVIAMYGNF